MNVLYATELKQLKMVKLAHFIMYILQLRRSKKIKNKKGYQVYILCTSLYYVWLMFKPQSRALVPGGSLVAG